MEQRKQEPLSCGEYLNLQRGRLDRITDLGSDAAREEARELLANIYAVNYQMMYERIEPPGPHRGPATDEPLDRALVEQVSRTLRDGAPEFQDIVSDSWRLSEAIHRSRQGNGFALVEMVNMAHLARTTAGKQAAARTAPPQPEVTAAEPQRR